MLEKDAVLNRLADHANVAQFVSFAPGQKPDLRFCRIRDADSIDVDLPSAVRLLMERSPENSLNIRSFRPGQTKGGEFLYGLRSQEKVISDVSRLSQSGWFVIVNETIDVNDGGVSGVSMGHTMEFAPGDTPRCVEKPGTCRLSFDLGNRLLQTVYGFAPGLEDAAKKRIEFSIHPIRRGHRHDHTVIWEVEDAPELTSQFHPQWPNRFSQFLGDKVFGLLIAYSCGVHVPRTVVMSRQVAPFVFGETTGTCEHWQRTAPSIQSPGQLPTTFGWTDPFETWAGMVRSGTAESCASLLSQEGVESAFAGAAGVTSQGSLVVEGVKGDGVGFMLGQKPPEALPKNIQDDVEAILEILTKSCGPVRIEWAHDGNVVWVLQLHVGGISSAPNVISEGEANTWVEYIVEEGLEGLRKLVGDISGMGIGVRLIGDVGITSHFGDLLREMGIPGVLVKQDQSTPSS
ncbi:hypothetical protein Pla175_17670 [Pirellulimonas nuda]|uniref:Uncharacterized protein n=1 Tax=Pirellulimonas nuda TaxID=2528009 RepID=A0A518DA86_9BACT|nr:hypothetical protein [Pirellulimonas nuda]QDU88391.1 hypothetical protein Pla175_17670 [Pirellulimonas nuda]